VCIADELMSCQPDDYVFSPLMMLTPPPIRRQAALFSAAERFHLASFIFYDYLMLFFASPVWLHI